MKHGKIFLGNIQIYIRLEYKINKICLNKTKIIKNLTKEISRT